MRTTDGAAELALASYEAFRSADLLATGVVARMLAGLSTRRYAVGLEPVGAAIEARRVGTSRSAVSRRFLAATSERLTELLSRPLADQRFLAVFLDGFRMASICSWARSGCGGLGTGIVTAKTLRRRLFGLVGRLTRSARRETLHLPERWPWQAEFEQALARLRAIPALA